MVVCSVDGCGGPIKGHGLCDKHYQRMRKGRPLEGGKGSHGSIDDRFWRNVDKRDPSACWMWIGHKRPNGYGQLHTGGRGGKLISAHRYSCQAHHGDPKDERMVAMHSCDTPGCVNPNHLRWGTASENIKEAFDKLRKRPTIMVGVHHPRAILNEDQVRFVKSNAAMGPSKLARICGVGKTTIRSVLSGKTWKHL